MASAQSLSNPNGCRHCGEDRETHVRLCHPEVGFHLWVEPTNEQRKERLKAARTAREDKS